MIVNVNNQEPDNENSDGMKIRVEGPVNMPVMIFATIFSLSIVVLSFFGLTGAFGEENDILSWLVLLGFGMIFFLVCLIIILAKFNIKSHWNYLISGIMLFLFSVVTFIANPLTGILVSLFGIIGIYMIIKAINSIRGKHDENKELDSKVSYMINSSVRKMADIDDDKTEYTIGNNLTEEEICLAEDNLSCKVNDFKKIITFIIILVTTGIPLLLIAISAIIIGVVFVVFSDNINDKLTGIGLIVIPLIGIIVLIILLVKFLKSKWIG